MQLVSSRIWTRVAVSISYDDNPHTTDTSSSSYKEASVPEPMFGFLSSSAHHARIAQSEPMTSKVQQGSSLSSSTTFP